MGGVGCCRLMAGVVCLCPQVNRDAKELRAAMSAGMEEKDDPGKHITLEAMSGLSKVLLYLDQKNVQLLVVYIFMKIKPFLENVRLAAFVFVYIISSCPAVLSACS